MITRTLFCLALLAFGFTLGWCFTLDAVQIWFDKHESLRITPDTGWEELIAKNKEEARAELATDFGLYCCELFPWDVITLKGGNNGITKPDSKCDSEHGKVKPVDGGGK